MSNWWANRLASNPSTAPRTAPPPLPTVGREETPRPQPSYNRPPASSLAQEHCPSCGSGNYMSAPGSQYKRCYDCGHPISQSGTGVGSTSADAPAKKATQVQGGGFNPTQIVGKVQ